MRCSRRVLCWGAATCSFVRLVCKYLENKYKKVSLSIGGLAFFDDDFKRLSKTNVHTQLFHNKYMTIRLISHFLANTSLDKFLEPTDTTVADNNQIDVVVLCIVAYLCYGFSG